MHNMLLSIPMNKDRNFIHSDNSPEKVGILRKGNFKSSFLSILSLLNFSKICVCFSEKFVMFLS